MIFDLIQPFEFGGKLFRARPDPKISEFQPDESRMEFVQVKKFPAKFKIAKG